MHVLVMVQWLADMHMDIAKKKQRNNNDYCPQNGKSCRPLQTIYCKITSSIEKKNVEERKKLVTTLCVYVSVFHSTKS